MNKYLELILKKKRLVEKMRFDLLAIAEQQCKILLEQPDLAEKYDIENNRLKKHKKENMEANIIKVIIASFLVLFLFLVTSLKVWMSLGWNFFLSSFVSVVSGLASLGLGLVCVKITHTFFQKWRRRNQDKFTSQKELVENLGRALIDLKGKYDGYTDEKQRIYARLDQESKELDLLKNAFIDALVQVENQKLEELTPLLDKMIEEDIAKRNNPVIDIDMKREKSF